jgi:DNA-binding MarR family transcriptional regulator
MSPRSALPLSIQSIAEELIHRSFLEVKQTIDNYGLSLTEVTTLIKLHFGEPCGVSDLSSEFQITKSGASQIVNKLIRWDYIYRIDDVIDRRKKLLYLTVAGQAIMEKLMEKSVLWLEDLLISSKNGDIFISK